MPEKVQIFRIFLYISAPIPRNDTNPSHIMFIWKSHITVTTHTHNENSVRLQFIHRIQHLCNFLNSPEA